MHEKEHLTQANAFRTLPRSDAQQAFPELRAAYVTVDALRKVAAASHPANARVAQRVDLAIRNHVADRVQSGASLVVDTQTREAARLEVAFANLQHAADERRGHGQKSYEMPSAERSRLIEAAGDVVSGTLRELGLSKEPARTRASQVARELSGIDYPARNNPFQAMQLRDLYQRDADYREIMEVNPSLRGPSLS